MSKLIRIAVNILYRLELYLLLKSADLQLGKTFFCTLQFRYILVVYQIKLDYIIP